MERPTPTQQWIPLSASEKIAVGQPTVAEDDVRRRAYELYLKRGANPGNPLWEWLQAERELWADVRSSAYYARP
jgi:hypothetical protein